MSTSVEFHLMVCNNAVEDVTAAASVDSGLHYATVHMHTCPRRRVLAACCCCASTGLLLLLLLLLLLQQHVRPAGLKATVLYVTLAEGCTTLRHA
jgi:hypothetical protein